MKKSLVSIWMAVAGILLAALALGGATYAWFTFQPYTNVEPLHSTVSSGDVALLISTDPEGEFRTTCRLLSGNGNLEPVSTSDLVHFYRGIRQNIQGIVTTYGDAAPVLEEGTLYGTLYIKSLSDDCDIYLHKPGVSFGEDTQMLSALRLGLIITVGEREYVYLLRLDSLGDTGAAADLQTTSLVDVVVASLDGEGRPGFIPDPAVDISRYFAADSGNDRPEPGQAALCTLDNGEIARVEYRLYLEGCDSNCFNLVQNREAWVQLSFAGVIEE